MYGRTLYTQSADMPEGDLCTKVKNKKYFTLRADGYVSTCLTLSAAIIRSACSLYPCSQVRDLTFAKAYGEQDKLNALINGSVGLMGQFNVSKYLDINIEARGEVSPSMFGTL